MRITTNSLGQQMRRADGVKTAVFRKGRKRTMLIWAAAHAKRLGIKRNHGINNMKPKVYIETSIPSYLTARSRNDLRAMANQNTTIEWWESRRSEFDIYISEFVVAESSQGHPEATAHRLTAIKEIPELDVTEEVRQLGKALVSEGPIPEGAEIDAYHIAVAAVNGMDYLLTWNCKHIANAVMRLQIEAVCRKHGYEPPIICTPQELMEG